MTLYDQQNIWSTNGQTHHFNTYHGRFENYPAPTTIKTSINYYYKPLQTILSIFKLSYSTIQIKLHSRVVIHFSIFQRTETGGILFHSKRANIRKILITKSLYQPFQKDTRAYIDTELVSKQGSPRLNRCWLFKSFVVEPCTKKEEGEATTHK